MYINNDTLNKMIPVFKKNHFSNYQIRRILRKFRRFQNDIETLDESYAFYAEKMKEFGYTTQDTIELAIAYPRVMFCQFYRKKALKTDYVEYLKNMKKVIDQEDIHFEYDAIIEILVDLGLTEKRIDYLFRESSDVITLSPAELNRRIAFYVDNGLSKEDVAIIASHNIRILELNEVDYKGILTAMSKIDMNASDLMDIFRRLKTSFSPNLVYMEAMFNWFAKLPINKKKFKKNIKKTAYLNNYCMESLEKHFQTFLNYGFTEEEACLVIDDTLSVLTFDEEKVYNRINILDEYNLSLEEKIHVVTSFPCYLTLSDENIKKKLEIASELGALDFIVEKPKNLIQSADLTLARAFFLKKNYPEDLNHHVGFHLYCAEERFKFRYKVSSAFVLAIYKHYNKKTELKKTLGEVKCNL